MNFENDFFNAIQQPTFNFEALALRLFRHQASTNPVYSEFVKLLGVEIGEIKTIQQIPFLPISFFKTHKITSLAAENSFYFTSSTTTDGTPSKHFVPNLNIYEWSFKKAFNRFYYSHNYYCILGLLPNYIERGGSSLVHMVQQFINDSKFSASNFYINDFHSLNEQLRVNEKNEIPTLLIGVTYALLDFAHQFPFPLKQTIVMETGGMKGRRKEILRTEVHEILKEAFSLESIHSEYGMTELLTQGYSKGNGIFECPPWMRVLVADLNDARTILPVEKNGSLHIIDLANIYSCAFIATDDLGLVHPDNTFEVLGRKDQSDLRGCGLLYTQ